MLLEVAPPGGHVQALADPVTLAHLAGLPPDAVDEAVDIAARNAESRAALVRRRDETPGHDGEEVAAWVEYVSGGDLRRLPLGGNYAELARAVTPGSVRALQLPPPEGETRKPGSSDSAVRDLFAPDLPRLERQPIVRRGSIDVQSVPLSILKEGTPGLTSPQRLSRLLGRRVVVEVDEPVAAFRGAMTTPGAPNGAIVCDVGAGTINVVDGGRSVTAAGAGDLLTLSTASVLDILRVAGRTRQALHIGEGPDAAPLHDENGGQRFSRPSDPR